MEPLYTLAQIEGEVLAQYGFMGISVLALAAFARQAYVREAERGDRLEGENKELRDRVEADVIPALTRAIDALERERRRHHDDGVSEFGG
jgi:hypothetical protein